MNTSEPTAQSASLDLQALAARAAARTPEEDALRQARVTSGLVGVDTLALARRLLSEGDLDEAHRWATTAAAHGAVGAHSVLDAVATMREIREGNRPTGALDADGHADLLVDLARTVVDLNATTSVLCRRLAGRAGRDGTTGRARTRLAALARARARMAARGDLVPARPVETIRVTP